MARAKTQTQEVPELEVTSRELGTLTELDPSTLDPNYQYRWVHKSGLKVSRMKARGYRTVTAADEEGIKNAVGDSPEAEDGTYTIGDVTLMRIPKQQHLARRHAQKRKTDKRLKGPVRGFKRKASEKTDRTGQSVEVITTKEPTGQED